MLEVLSPHFKTNINQFLYNFLRLEVCVTIIKHDICHHNTVNRQLSYTQTTCSVLQEEALSS